jgi:hypothetical protein
LSLTGRERSRASSMRSRRPCGSVPRKYAWKSQKMAANRTAKFWFRNTTSALGEPPTSAKNSASISGRCPACGGAMAKLGEDVTEVLDYIPGRFRVVRHVRPKYACRHCDAITQAAAPALPTPRGRAAPGMLAHLLVSKYTDHLPLYRQREIYARDGLAPEELPHPRRQSEMTANRTLGLPDFVFDKWADATPVEQFKAMRCLLDQCCKAKAANTQLYDELDRATGKLAQGIVQDPARIRKGLLDQLSPAHLLTSRRGGFGLRSNPARERALWDRAIFLRIEPGEGLDTAGMNTIISRRSWKLEAEGGEGR